jgi:hypothetical protein
MSKESVKQIIGRALTESDYRELLFGDPEKALEGYDLTEEEAAALNGLEQGRFDAMAGELEERVSKSGMRIPELEIPKSPEVSEVHLDDDLMGRLLESAGEDGSASATPINIP